jgi:hypothetical protein
MPNVQRPAFHPWKPGDPEHWPVHSVLGEWGQRISEAEERSHKMLQNATPIDALSPSQETVLAVLLAGKSVTDAATAAGVDRTTVHRWLKEDLGFPAAFNRARRELREALTARLMALAERPQRPSRGR